MQLVGSLKEGKFGRNMDSLSLSRESYTFEVKFIRWEGVFEQGVLIVCPYKQVFVFDYIE